MKGFIAKMVGTACLGSLAAATGCVRYQDVVDPCWPERYEYIARQEVNGALAPQVRNGHILDQTIWNYHFEVDENSRLGTDKLTPAGVDRLVYLSRRRPTPDNVIYLQTAYDLPFDAARADEYAQKRSDLDRSRIDTVQRFLKAQTAGRPVPFEVVVHDPSPVGLAGTPAGRTITPPTGFYNNFRGDIPIGGLFGGGSSGGGGGGGGGGR